MWLKRWRVGEGTERRLERSEAWMVKGLICHDNNNRCSVYRCSHEPGQAEDTGCPASRRTSGLRGTLALETKIRGVTEGRNGAFRQGEGSHRFRGVMQG